MIPSVGKWSRRTLTSYPASTNLPCAKFSTYSGPNKDLLELTNQVDMSVILMERGWRWIGHILRKDATPTTKIKVHWTPE